MSRINWPPSLIEDIARSRCIFFLGAGVSAGAKTLDPVPKRPKTWDNFLTSINDSFITDPSDKGFIARLIEEKDSCWHYNVLII